MLSSNHGGFYSNGKQYSFMQVYIYIIVRNVFFHELLHSWFKRMMIACTHGVCDCPGYPGSVCAIWRPMLEDSMTSVKMLYSYCNYTNVSNCFLYSIEDPFWRSILSSIGNLIGQWVFIRFKFLQMKSWDNGRY